MGPRMILIAYDGSKPSFDAIDDLRRAGLPKRGMASVLSVADTDPVGDLGRRARTLDRSTRRGALTSLPMNVLQREKLEEAIDFAMVGADSAQRQLPDWHVDALVMTAHPARAIVASARDCYAEMIVLGSHGRGAVQRLLLGSISRQVLDEAHCTVHIGRRRPESSVGPMRVVLGLDRSADCETLLHAIAVRDWPLGTTVHLVAAASEEERIAAAGDGTDLEYSPQIARERACEAAAVLERHGIETSWKLVDHAYPSAVIGAATSLGADLIVLDASRSDASFIAGVIAATRCSVEAVRPVTVPSKMMLERYEA